MSSPGLDPALLTKLDTPDVAAALRLLTESDLHRAEIAEQLTTIALEQAEQNPQAAAHWLATAAALNDATGQEAGLQAQIRYAQARLSLHQGNTTIAESQIRQAQELWRSIGADAALARSYLGLTQVLTVQGRYAEAEEAIQQAIQGLPENSVQQAQAFLNLANLLRFQERHEEALPHYASARIILEQQLATAEDEQHANLLSKLAGLAVNQSIVLMFLDRPLEAEAALLEALSRFDQAGDRLNRGKARTNLGSLYLRTGRYAEALNALTQASVDLLGEISVESPDTSQLRQADILLLEQANAYLALNLIPEAIAELERAIELFRSVPQPYELGQSLYTLGMVRLRNGEPDLAQATLDEAWRIFGELDNPYWQNRVCVALATVAYRQGSLRQAADRLDTCLAGIPSNGHELNGSEGKVTAWDVGLIAEARLLRLRLHLETGEIKQAQACARQISALLNVTGASSSHREQAAAPMPHLRLRLEHALGSIALTSGNAQKAEKHFRNAVALLEQQRISLPLEEIKTAYLDDKANIYDDLIYSMLARTSTRSSDKRKHSSADIIDDPEIVAQVFATMEQARSRTLLDRLMASGEDPAEAVDENVASKQRELRRGLHWLYNQLMEAKSPEDIRQRQRQLQTQEAALQRLEWQTSSLLTLTRPVELAAFQRILAPDQQALIYYVAQASTPIGDSDAVQVSSGEVMVLLVGKNDARLFRHLGTARELEQMGAELRFQLGRAELGTAYLARHRERLTAGLHTALARLYERLIGPVAEHLTSYRLLLVPHGKLHQLPLHILWNGEQYLLERFECTYLPSASLAVHTGTSLSGEHAGPGAYRSLAGLALTDPIIPQARQEVIQAASHFPRSWIYLDDLASRDGLRTAARQADVLHIATHGLFRPDNPFFSALKLADGWIDVREIYRLPLAARLVVLSACESGVGRVRGGDEVIGLARGFLGAGARNLMVSLWNVHDASAAALTDAFYRQLAAAARPAAALRAAQIEAIHRKQHPYFWAPFLVIG
jgi:CHAT domain-containing protein/tetratricopeptide (TPR) repeat protein